MFESIFCIIFIIKLIYDWLNNCNLDISIRVYVVIESRAIEMVRAIDLSQSATIRNRIFLQNYRNFPTLYVRNK